MPVFDLIFFEIVWRKNKPDADTWFLNTLVCTLLHQRLIRGESIAFIRSGIGHLLEYTK